MTWTIIIRKAHEIPPDYYFDGGARQVLVEALMSSSKDSLVRSIMLALEVGRQLCVKEMVMSE